MVHFTSIYITLINNTLSISIYEFIYVYEFFTINVVGIYLFK